MDIQDNNHETEGDRQTQIQHKKNQGDYNEGAQHHRSTEMRTEMGKSEPRLTFFDLPREIRDEIYRCVHINSKPIGANNREWDHEVTIAKLRPFSRQLTAQAFRVCRQWHTEARFILYSENTFGIAVNAKRVHNNIVLQAVDAVKDHLFPLEIVTRINIVLHVCDDNDIRLARALVGLLAWALAIPTKLQRLNIALRVGPQVNFSYRMLERLTSLRNVGQVIFKLGTRRDRTYSELPDIPKNYVLYLRSFMEAGSNPRPLRSLATPKLYNFFKMYQALIMYSYGYDVDDALTLACKAMVECDIHKFKKARQVVIDLADPKSDHIPPWLLKYDSEVSQKIRDA